MKSIITTRRKNWKKRKKALQNKNALDITYNNDTWTFKGRKLKNQPYIILHDDKFIFWKYLKNYQRGVNKKKFLSHYSGFGRYKPFVVYKKKIPFIFIETGIGSASTYRVLDILSALNVGGVIKVGTISGLSEQLARGHIVIPKVIYADEGASKFHEGQASFAFQKVGLWDESFTNNITCLINQAHLDTKIWDTSVAIWSVDAYENFDICTDLYDSESMDLATRNIVGVEMECSSLFFAAQRHKLKIAAVLAVIRAKDQLLNKHERARDKSTISYSSVEELQAQIIHTIIKGIAKSSKGLA